MYRWNNNGGWNKTHGQVEKTPRIDSYEAAAVQGLGHLLGYADGGIPLVLDCHRSIIYEPETDREVLEVWNPKDGRGWELELSRKPNGFGGNQAFFLCPACGRRVRYLYKVGAAFLCRKCSRLNYKSQQETRSGAMYYYDKGMALVERRLDSWPRVRPDGFSFCTWIPERPRYMHGNTYRRYLLRFLRYQEKQGDREMEDLARILRILK